MASPGNAEMRECENAINLSFSGRVCSVQALKECEIKFLLGGRNKPILANLAKFGEANFR